MTATLPSPTPTVEEPFRLLDAYWRAANYLSVGQIYLLDNPLLSQPLQAAHVKPRLLGHWGTTPGLNFIYVHLNRIIRERDREILFVAGPGHGGPAVVANAYLEGTYGELYPEVGQDLPGLRELFRQFSFPGGIPSHASPETPGSLHEGGELGYSLAHAFGAAFDNPDLTVACVVGDGEAETGTLAASWHANKFLNPAVDGAVLPILHLNGYKIANPTLLARMPRRELEALFVGYGYAPIFVEGTEPAPMHAAMAAALDAAFARIDEIQRAARVDGELARPVWPMVILRSPKGWTGPAEVDSRAVEGTCRSHQVPLSSVRERPDHLAQLEWWLRSYRAEELFDDAGALRAEIRALAPSGDRRMSACPHANGGQLSRPLRLPRLGPHAVEVDRPAAGLAEATRALGTYLRDVIALNPDNFRLFGPDETTSNRLDAVFEVTGRVWLDERRSTDEHLAPGGRVVEVLSEQLCQGWLEGYTLTGRHGLFSCYEAFVHVVDSMFNQHAKWLATTREIPWRRPVPSLNYLLTSHVWRQDHNGFSHQDPGFIDLVVNKRAEVVRVYFPPDANTLLAVSRECLASQHRVNVIVAGKQPGLQYLSLPEAVAHVEEGLGVWSWASNDHEAAPDVVMACCGDVPTMETLAAVACLRERVPKLRVRVVNVVDLMRLQSPRHHPHGLGDRAYDLLFPPSTPVVFAYHGYPSLIHRLVYDRRNHAELIVRGYHEQGTTTTPFDMVVRNALDRYSLVATVAERVAAVGPGAIYLKDFAEARLAEHRRYIREAGEDLPEIRNWRWSHA